MSHGPCGLGGGALLSACAGAAAVNMTPMSATARAQRADLLRCAPRPAPRVDAQCLGFCCLLGSWLTPTGKRLIARPLPLRSRCWQAAGVENRRVPHASPPPTCVVVPNPPGGPDAIVSAHIGSCQDR